MSYPGQAQHDVERFEEYAYTLDEIRRACEAAGLQIASVVDGEALARLAPKASAIASRQ